VGALQIGVLHLDPKKGSRRWKKNPCFVRVEREGIVRGGLKKRSLLLFGGNRVIGIGGCNKKRSKVWWGGERGRKSCLGITPGGEMIQINDENGERDS